MANRQISPERQGVYYFGMALIVIGFLMFFSVFLTVGSMFGSMFGSPGISGNFGNPFGTIPLRAFGGMGLMILGGFLKGIGQKGLAGSGIVLDPEQAREDVEPWARMAGGVVKDALDEAEISVGQPQHAEALPFDEQLRRLHKLREEGLLTEKEYQTKKEQILREV